LKSLGFTTEDTEITEIWFARVARAQDEEIFLCVLRVLLGKKAIPLTAVAYIGAVGTYFEAGHEEHELPVNC
jgi:hypothetical protein